MNVFRKKTVLAVFAISLVSSYQAAIAASSAQAVIDWNSFNVQIIDLSGGVNAPVFNWTSSNGSSSANSATQDPYEYQSSYLSAYNLSSILSTGATTTLARSSALRSDSMLQANAASLGSGRSNSSSASVFNSGNFQVTGYGLALLTLNWNVSATADTQQDYGFSSIALSGNFYDHNGNGGSAYSNYAINSAYSNTTSHAGVFALAIYSDGTHNSTGSLNVSALASTNTYSYNGSFTSPVPVPAAVWLFGSSLIGLFSITRRKPLAS